MVVEIKTAPATWDAFMAKRPLQGLDDAIKGHHAAFYMAQSDFTPGELKDLLPVSLPMTHKMPEFPGVAHYPVDEWEAAGAPMMTVTGWTQLCMRIASKHLEELGKIFDVAKKVDPTAAAEELAAIKEGSPCPSRASSSTRASSSRPLLIP